MEAKNIHSVPGFAKGLRPADHSRAHLKFGDFLKAIPTAPIVDLAPMLTYPMDGNDTVGDCVVAAWDHAMQVITNLLTGTGQNFTQDQIWAFYKTQNPNFDPNGTAATNGPGSSADGGMNIQTFLEYLQQNGYILGFAKIDQTNPQEVQSAIYIGLALMCGVILDEAQMTQFSTGTWDNVPGSPVDGGHGIPAVGYPASGLTCVSWAALVNCTESFVVKQMDEMWFIVTPLHVQHPGFRDSFDIEAFAAAVSAITGGQINIPVPTPKPEFYFGKNLSMGQTDPAVIMLQKCLNYDPATALKAAPGAAGSPGNETDFYGALTFNAVEAYQAKYSIPVLGMVGPLTRAHLNAQFSLTVSPAGIAFIKQYEGFSATPYQDVGGTWTIGYGFTYDINGDPITANTPVMTEAQATQELLAIVSTYVDGVLGALTVSITQNQLDALTSFTYNLGVGTFESSSICAKLNAKQPILEGDFTQYSIVKGVQNAGLLARRQAEFALFNS